MTDQVFLAIGRSGNGKSTICNVVSNSTHFGESAAMVAETFAHTAETFPLAGGGSIRLVDTIGIGDNRIDKAEVFHMIARACHEVAAGFHQLIFVTRGRFSVEEMEAFKLFENVILDRNVTRFTTIVRTDFPDYDDPAACAADIASMKTQNPESNRILSSCHKVIHVYTPPPHRHTPNSAGLRLDARTKLLAHLGTCQTLYRPPNLDQIETQIAAKLDEESRLERELRETQTQIQQLSTQNAAQAAAHAATLQGLQQQLDAAREEAARASRIVIEQDDDSCW